MTISWQNVEQMNNYPLENVHTHIALEAFQDLSFSDYVMKQQCRTESIQWGKERSLFIFLHLSSFCVIFTCMTEFSWLKVGVQCYFRQFPIESVYLTACLMSLTNGPVKHCKPCGQLVKSSVFCLFGFIPFLLYHSVWSAVSFIFNQY